MQKTVILPAVSLLALIIVGVLYQSRSAHIDALESRVDELEQKVIAVTAPMQTLREDISMIYTELDDIQADASEGAEGGGRDIVAERARREARRAEYRLPPAVAYPVPQYDTYETNNDLPYGTKLPTHSSFNTANDDENG